MGKLMEMSADYYICPTCDNEVRVGSDGCPTCNAGEDRHFDGDGIDLDLPEDELFDYDRFVADEFGGAPQKSAKEWFWWAVAVITLIAFIALALFF